MKPKLSCKIASLCCVISISIIIFIIYSFELEDIVTNLPYGADIARRIQTHRESFKWYSSLSNGNYCKPINNERMKHYKKRYRKYNVNDNDTFNESRKRIFLLSYPRSGNHLTRAVLECLLNYPTYGYQRERYSVYIERNVAEYTALRYAQRYKPYIRKYHSVDHIKERMHQFGLILLLRDPVECVNSEMKNRPFFWKDYEHQMEIYLDLVTFYKNWKNEDTKLLLYYRDYFNISEKWLNLLKIQSYFGKDIISDERMEFCIENFENVTNVALSALERTTSLQSNMHHYRDSYYGKNSLFWPVIKVPSNEYEILSVYENLRSC